MKKGYYYQPKITTTTTKSSLYYSHNHRHLRRLKNFALFSCTVAVVVLRFIARSSIVVEALAPQQQQQQQQQQRSSWTSLVTPRHHGDGQQNLHENGVDSLSSEDFRRPTKKRRRQGHKSNTYILTTAADSDDDSVSNNSDNYDNYDHDGGRDSHQATIMRSLEHKHHIEYQYDQITYQHDSKRRALNTLTRILTRLEHKHNLMNLVNMGDNSRRRQLQNEFENAFGQGTPGSTYGYNMFCGSSWSEASTSCPQRQNCPSGQSSECIMPGQQCWAFTECDTRKGDGEQFSEFHNVVPGENLAATGVGAAESGGYVDLTKPSNDKSDHYFCGKGYDDAITRCGTHCPSGNMNDCPFGEICFLNTPCDARLMTIAPVPANSPTMRPTTFAPVTYESKINKYYCGFDWNDAQKRCEIWCPSGRDDHCPKGQVCMAFTACNAVDMNGMTLEQIEKQQQEANGGGSPTPTIAGKPTYRPTLRPVLTAEQAMHRYSFCGKFWVDARDNCDTKQHCEDDNDCPDAELCWTQTPCDYYATEPPTTGPPSRRPMDEPIAPTPTRSPSKSSIGPPTQKPTPGPPTLPPTIYPTMSPTITPRPTDKPVIDPNDPSFTFYCGTSWEDADAKCPVRCPSGGSQECPAELECWAFTTCKSPNGYATNGPTGVPTPSPLTLYVPGYGGAKVPVFGGVDFAQLEPTVSPVPTVSIRPSLEPTLPPGVVAKEVLATYYCGIDWNDVETNCHQPCPSGSNMECENPEHYCWAFVEKCRAKTLQPTGSPVTEAPTSAPVTSTPTRDPSSPTTLFPTASPLDLYGFLEAQKKRKFCAATWDGIVCGESIPCPSGNNDDCPTGQSCYIAEFDCSKPQPKPVELPPTTQRPSPPSEPASSGEESNNSGIDNEGEDWGDDDGVDNEGEDWSTKRPTNKPSPNVPTTPSPTIDLLGRLDELKGTYYCAFSWSEIDCENAIPCPSGDPKECPKKNMSCFSGTPCKGNKPSASIASSGTFPGSSPSPTIWTPLLGDKPNSNNIVTEVDNATSKYFCGSSWNALVDNCAEAKPCPSGSNAECEGGQSCFADTPCGKVTSSTPSSKVGELNFAAMVDTIPPYCKDKKTMSRNVGYWQSWSIYREDDCNPFTSESIDASSYTHIVFSFASISAEGTLEPWDFEADIEGGEYQKFLKVRERYPGIKLLIAVGGWTHNDPENERLYRFSNAASTEMNRMKFAQSAVNFMREYGYDGLDIDWEYPGDETRGGNATIDKRNLVLLCEELRKFFDAASEGFQLTIAIPASIARFESGFDLGGIAKSVDFFNVMAYDMHGVWDFPPVTGAHSDIAGINEAIDFMLTDVAASQIVMGMPAYGRSYTMVDESCLALGCPFDESSNETAIGGCLDTSGFVPYVEIYDWTQMGEGRGYDSITVDLTTYSAVMVKDGNQFISYDNLETFKAKVDYASKRCLGGTMVWAIDMIPLGTQSAGGSGNAGSGQSVLTEEQAVLAFCGTSWDDAVSTCSRPCPSGLSDDCNKGETCFAGTPCGSGGAVPVGETCQICPDSTSYGIRSWVDVEVKVDGTSTSTTCGELDYGVLRSVSKDSDACDKVQLELSQKCCYTYPQDQCLLCRKGGEYLNIRSDVNVTWPDGTEASCSLVNSMLSPEEDTSEMCVTTKDNLFDSCCYHACNLCEGKGLKWWVEFEENNDGGDRRQQEGTEVAPNEEEGGSGEDPKGTKSCSSIDASLYADFVEVNSDQCLETKSTYQLDCCYEFPTNACSLCGGQTLLWATEVEYEGKIVTCGVTDNIVNTEDESSPTCTSARGKLSSSCCFDKCKLCDNEQLAWDYVIDYYNDTSKTCGDIEAIFAANEVMSDSEVCSSTKEDFQDLCCFTPPITPCELCPEYIRWDEVVELQGVKSTCKEATAILKRDEEFGDQCKIAKEHMQETCCYELCDVCGDSLMLDWDAVVEYEGESVACGDLKQILGRDEIEEGSDACDVAKSTHRDFCCYTPPDKPCNMCQKETTYFDTYSTVEVDFLGTLMNCSAVYDYLIRRIESESESCSSAKNSVFDQCCYNKCAICGGGQSQDFEEQIELDGELISCMQLHTVRTNDVAAESDTCQSMQSKFSSTCCYDAPSTPCVLCAEGAVRKEVVVDFGGDTESCDQIANFLANRASNGTDECSTAKAELMQHCCFDKCRLCKESEEINWDGYVTFEGKDDVSCGSFDWYFMTNVIEDGSDHCLQIISAFSKQCCYEPIDYSTPACTLCKKGDVWYEINGAVKVYFEGSSRTCTDVSNSLFRKYDEQNGFCDAARNEYFDACCFEKCDICQGSLLDANVEVAYNGTATTCLELGVMFAANIVQEGSEECEAAKSALFEPCCYQSPSDPCVFCQSMTKGKAGEVRKNVDVNFYGSTTTCFDLNSFLVAREEQLGFMCQAAKAELQETCCFQKCDICDGGNLYWDNPVQFNGATFACGELTWIITGNVYEEGSGDCNQIQATYYDTCCNGPSPDIPNAANKCEICPDGKDLYAPVVYGEKTITCLELDSVLLRNAVFGNSAECKQVTQEYSPTCCYTPPISPCNLCHVGRNAYSVAEGTVEFNGAQSDCYGIHNYLSTRVEAEDDVCIVAQHDLFEKCCYDKCSLCQSYRLNNEAVVIMDDVKMSCSEIENNFIGLNQITQGSEQCSLLQQQHFNNCCYDVPCDVCEEDDMSYELLVQSPATYKGSNITCGEVAMLAKQEMSQSDVCKTTKNNLFASCCYKQCNLCKNTGWAIEWNKKLTFDNLASTCLDVFMNLRSEMIQQGDDKCQSIQYTVSYECCYKLPTNQCSLCQASNGTFLNTNWDSEVKYQEKKMTCGDVHAILSSEEIDGALCLEARETLWSQCCTPQKGKINLPTLPSGVSDNTGSWPDYGDTGFGNFVMSNGALSPSLCIFAALILIVMAALFTVDDIANKS